MEAKVPTGHSVHYAYNLAMMRENHIRRHVYDFSGDHRLYGFFIVPQINRIFLPMPLLRVNNAGLGLQLYFILIIIIYIYVYIYVILYYLFYYMILIIL